jgi:hypothetical protein
MIIIANWGLGDILCGLSLAIVSIVIYYNVHHCEDHRK